MLYDLRLYLTYNKISFRCTKNKMEKVMKNLRLNKYLIILMISLFGSVNILANTLVQDDKTINEFTSILKQKVLLSNDQEAKVLGIMTELQKNTSAKPENKPEYVKTAQTKVESLLDSKQKMKYDIIKNDLWKKI
jgi:hypothetical protein